MSTFIITYFCGSPTFVRCFKRITFDESLLSNINPIVDTYEDQKSIGMLNQNFHPRGIKIFDPNFAIAAFHNNFDAPKHIQLLTLKF
jgi:hypothetical protein